MAQIPLKRLRDLRLRADRLLTNVDTDLRAFIHAKDPFSFRRKPDSESRKGDLNVTTTCSCVMALALTNKFHDFYIPGKKDGSDDANAQEILKGLVNAPWMSSGLTSNNAFTTALVLRTYGFLKHHNLLTSSFKLEKAWDLELSLSDPRGLARQLKLQRTETTRFLYRSLSDKTRSLLKKASPANTRVVHNKKIRQSLTTDLRHIVHASWIYHRHLFPHSKKTVRELDEHTDSYKRAELNHNLLAQEFRHAIKQPEKRSFAQIAQIMAKHADNFRINDYPPATPVVYWFVDGVSKAGIRLGASLWKVLLEFARNEFNHQHSLVVAKHDAMMDPVTMGMAACLCARLRSICSNQKTGISAEDLATLPSRLELERSVREIFGLQTLSGIWPKYFPMFHYQEAGSNFCFTFELLEAVLHEFGDKPNELLNDSPVIEGLEKAVTWCEDRRLKTSEGDSAYSGWNSGGDITTLQRDIPESWATAVVHMFLWELSGVLSHHIRNRLLEKYSAQPPEASDKRLDDLLDVDLSMQGNPEHLITLLKDEFFPSHSTKSKRDLRRGKINKPVSALLFGPPGTSKTALTKALAKDLNWPLIVINSSEFVKDSLANVYLRTDEIFSDLDDMSAAVVFFDEMDALTQSRAERPLDTPTQFLTTSMLPKLTALHDKGRVVFLMATNYQSRFDHALKRAGRFDLLLCMGPPTLSEKLKRLKAFFSEKSFDPMKAKQAAAKVRKYAKKGTWLYAQLELFTFDEFKHFLNRIGNGTNIGNKLASLRQHELEDMVRDYSKYVTLKLDDLSSKHPDAFSKWKFRDWDDFPIDDIKPKQGEELSEMERYLLDRRESKSQYK